MNFNEVVNIINRFNFEGDFVSINSNVCGNINDTYVLEFNLKNEKKRYILQRINTDIFGDPKKLMDNIRNVTEHIKSKIEEVSGDVLRETLTLLKTKNGEDFYRDDLGNCWRVFLFIEGARTYQIVEEPRHMYTTGKALGKFQKQLADFDASKLNETIADFHNTYKRYIDFKKAVSEDKLGRKKLVEEEIAYIMNHEKEMNILVNELKQGNIPLRVTHNDTKFNNIMIDDKSGEGIAVIDLDTVMPGLSLYDFGDAVRSGANTALEDEADLNKVNFDFNLYEEFTKGYLEEAKDNLNKKEIELLPFSIKLIGLELSMRFLGDYLNGDIYFKVSRDRHNLDRARNQLKLVKDIEGNLKLMTDIVKKYI